MVITPGSSDEGEIVENGVGDAKASSLPRLHDSGVDRKNRNRAAYSRSRSPEYGNDSRYQSGYSRRSRSPRGQKRPRDDRDAYRSGRVDADPRRFRVHYEDSRDKYQRSREPYDDEDRPPSRSAGSGLYYDDDDREYSRNRARDRSRDRDHERDRDRNYKRPRNRTRSPYRPPRSGRDQNGRPRREEHGATRRGDRDGSESVRSGYAGSPRYRQDSGTPKQVSFAENSKDAPEKDPLPDKDFEEEKPVDVDAEIERRRKRREELLSKSRVATPMLVQALQQSEKASQPAGGVRAITPVPTEGNTPKSGTVLRSPRLTDAPLTWNSAVSSPSSPAPGLQEGMSPAALDISNDQELINLHGGSGDLVEDGPSAADYDPTADMREDELRDELRNGHVGPHGQLLESEEKAEIPQSDEPKQSEPDADDDDEFDMFAEDFDESKLVAPKPSQNVSAGDDRKVPGQANAGGILEGDDKDGYYKIRIGEVMLDRYQVQSMLGKGMFSGVARAIDITTKQTVAIKMMRNNDALRKGGFTEIAILQKLNNADPENRKHVIKFERHFDYKGHLCLAFENLSLNLREVLKKFGNNVGINLNATRAYAHQMFVALAHFRKCSIIHADLKPDNILVNETRNLLKICDLGTAIDRSDAATAHTEITPYLVSRFYRAPELILGMPYDYGVDMWSIGCTLYELYTGKILFTGDSNNQMLKAIMEIRGKISPKMYKRGELAPMHFDEGGNFVSVEHDKTLGKTTVRTLPIVKPTRDLRTRLMATSGGMNDKEARELNLFIDLLDRCLTLNPEKRITPSEALKHAFFTTRLAMR